MQPMMNEGLGEKFRVMGVDDQGLPANMQAELAAAQDKSFINWDDIPEDGTLDEASCKEHVLLIKAALSDLRKADAGSAPGRARPSPTGGSSTCP